MPETGTIAPSTGGWMYSMRSGDGSLSLQDGVIFCMHSAFRPLSLAGFSVIVYLEGERESGFWES
jgi:hypothetical protein